MCESFNGYKNRETWAVMLYISNDVTLDSLALEVVKSASADSREDALRTLCATYWTVSGYVAEFGDSEPYPVELAAESQDIGSLYRVDWSVCVEALLAV